VDNAWWHGNRCASHFASEGSESKLAASRSSLTESKLAASRSSLMRALGMVEKDGA
jgi:hypothetical protein